MNPSTGESNAIVLNDFTVAGYMACVRSTAVNFARRKHKHLDPMFIEECIAEANFWLVIIFNEYHAELIVHDNPVAYIRSKVGYKLREYFAPYATSTMSYLKKKGELVPQTDEYEEASEPNLDYLARENTDTACFECIQSILLTPLDWKVYEHHLLGQNNEEVGKALKIRPRKAKKVLTRIKKRLLALQSKKDADVPTSC